MPDLQTPIIPSLCERVATSLDREFLLVADESRTQTGGLMITLQMSCYVQVGIRNTLQLFTLQLLYQLPASLTHQEGN